MTVGAALPSPQFKLGQVPPTFHHSDASICIDQDDFSKEGGESAAESVIKTRGKQPAKTTPSSVGFLFTSAILVLDHAVGQDAWDVEGYHHSAYKPPLAEPMTKLTPPEGMGFMTVEEIAKVYCYFSSLICLW